MQSGDQEPLGKQVGKGGQKLQQAAVRKSEPTDSC